MLYYIDNGCLRVAVSPAGAELMSIRSSSGTEYLWQGDGKYWSDRAPNIFPYVARLTGGCYTYQGKTYHMPIHGFAPYICLEPWSSLPSRQDVVEDLETQPDLLSPEAGKTYTTTWSLRCC